MGDDKQTPKRFNSGDVLFSINQITNPSLSCSSESTDAVDAMNVPIATFYRAKTCEFSAENALFDMSLLATQSGTVKKVAGGNTSNITAPCFESIDIVANTTKYALAHTPKANTTPKVYILNGDGTLGNQLTVTDSASEYNVVIAEDTVDGSTTYGKTVITIALPTVNEFSSATASYSVGTYVTYGTGDSKKVYKCKTAINSAAAWDASKWDEVKVLSEGGQIFLMYEYTADGTKGNGAVEVVNSANNFPVGCKFIMEILGADVCDQTNLIYAYLIFPNKLSV